jgi:HD domain
MGRLRQGFRALFAWAQPVDVALAATILPPQLLLLFQRMRRSEQQHSLNVLRTLQAQGESDPALLAAALIHDLGKSQVPFYLWDRVIVVLVKAAAPELAKRWGQAAPVGWQRPFAVSLQHPGWGAEMASKAGADPLLVQLIAEHQQRLGSPPRNHVEALLLLLQRADDAN